MKRVIFVIKELNKIRILAYDDSKAESIEYTIDLSKELNAEDTIRKYEDYLRRNGFDTRFLRRFIERGLRDVKNKYRMRRTRHPRK